MLYIASDHGGFVLKEAIKDLIEEQGGRIVDLGPTQLVPDDDYPDYAGLVAAKVAQKPEENFGILICRSGQGMCITANKFKGVRAGVVWNMKQAKASRADDHTNVLCLPADFVPTKQIPGIVKAWLATPWSNDPRHLRRLKKITAIERKQMK